jgi:hypothetical protein
VQKFKKSSGAKGLTKCTVQEATLTVKKSRQAALRGGILFRL